MAMILAERKVSGWIQDRHGPNRVGPWGILQPIADGIKFLLKEDLVPDHVDKPIYLLAPAIILVPALVTCGVVPFGSSITISGYEIPLQIADINIGVLYITRLLPLWGSMVSCLAHGHPTTSILYSVAYVPPHR